MTNLDPFKIYINAFDCVISIIYDIYLHYNKNATHTYLRTWRFLNRFWDNLFGTTAGCWYAESLDT